MAEPEPDQQDRVRAAFARARAALAAHQDTRRQWDQTSQAAQEWAFVTWQYFERERETAARLGIPWYDGHSVIRRLPVPDPADGEAGSA
jgi:hypothetical protein